MVKINGAFLGSSLLLAMTSTTLQAQAPSTEQMWDIIQKQQAEIEALKSQLNKTDDKLQETEVKVLATADAVENSNTTRTLQRADSARWTEKTHIGGYGEHHFNHFRDNADEVDAHRYVTYLNHKFTDKVSFFSEVELEHSLAGEGKNGEVELEQAYIKWDYAQSHSVSMGLFLIPVGILNETHEPDTFYGTERNVVEQAIIPTTWWETGVMFHGEIFPAFTYDAGVHSGLKTPVTGNSAFKVRSGRQKSSEAIAEDLAFTGRLKFTGIPGLELATTVQYQQDVDQNSPGDADATLLEAHAIYNIGNFGLRALWASWDIDSTAAKLIGRDEQEGWYIEPSYKILDNLGIFARYSETNNEAGLSSSEELERWDYGVNYWLTENVVLKADYTNNQDVDGKDNDSFNLGVGWSFY